MPTQTMFNPNLVLALVLPRKGARSHFSKRVRKAAYSWGRLLVCLVCLAKQSALVRMSRLPASSTEPFRINSYNQCKGTRAYRAACIRTASSKPCPECGEAREVLTPSAQGIIPHRICRFILDELDVPIQE